MSTKNDGGPAFPLTGTQWNPDRDAHEVSPVDSGMTLRDYFAAKAMQGFCANSAHAVLDGEHEFKAAAKEAYFMADAMLRARGE